MENNDILTATRSRILDKTVIFGSKGCLMWTGIAVGTPGLKYGKIRAKFPGEPVSKYYYVHRLMFMAHNNMFQLPQGLHVSHLCKFSLCCNPIHLNLEPQAVNNSRQSCTDKCHGHTLSGISYPECIF
jgi:hypothetical protein